MHIWALIKKNDIILIHGVRRIRRWPIRTWLEAIKVDLRVVNLATGVALNRDEWKKRTYVVDPKNLDKDDDNNNNN